MKLQGAERLSGALDVRGCRSIPRVGESLYLRHFHLEGERERLEGEMTRWELRKERLLDRLLETERMWEELQRRGIAADEQRRIDPIARKWLLEQGIPEVPLR